MKKGHDPDWDAEQPRRVRRNKAKEKVRNQEFFSIDGKRIDLRTERGLRFKTIKNDLERACGYPETLWERNLIRQIATTSVCVEELQRDIIAGRRVDLDAFVRLNGNLLRQYQLLGLQ